MASRAILALVIGAFLLVTGIVSAGSMFPAVRGSPDALSERVEISQKGYHNVTSDFDADVQMAFSISIINFSSGDSVEAYVLGPGNLTYGELTVNSILGVEAFTTDISGNYSLIVYNPGNEGLDIRYFLGPTISPTASLAFGAGTLLTLGGVVALIVAAVFAVIDRKGGS
jgi:hypothetical protein